MRLVLLGPPGAGKGTQAKRITEDFHLLHLSAGDLLREAVAKGTPEGKEAEGHMNKGALVPDALILSIIRKKIDHLDSGFILDGFPRTLNQAAELDTFVPLDMVISIEVPFDLLLQRLTGRRSCPACGAVFHVLNNPPAQDDICDDCGSSLIQRADDNEQTVRSRIDTYVSQTQPLIEYYESRNILRHVDGSRDIDSIYREINSILRNFE